LDLYFAQQLQGGPNINQFLNPYQQYVTDEIARQGQMAQNQLSAQAINAGAFGGAREGVQRAELQRATQANIGQSLASGFQQAVRVGSTTTRSNNNASRTITWSFRWTTTSNATS
jgi:hypothetical protein